MAAERQLRPAVSPTPSHFDSQRASVYCVDEAQTPTENENEQLIKLFIPLE